MYRIKEDHEEQMEIKKSRFITYLHRTESEADAKAFLTAIRRLHPDATHHCYAFIIGEHNEIKRSNDDGEPAGTAGVPMLECLDRNHMQDIIAITVRYFGVFQKRIPRAVHRADHQEAVDGEIRDPLQL